MCAIRGNIGRWRPDTYSDDKRFVTCSGGARIYANRIFLTVGYAKYLQEMELFLLEISIMTLIK